MDLAAAIALARKLGTLARLAVGSRRAEDFARSHVA
jgi:hypothetical protein